MATIDPERWYTVKELCAAERAIGRRLTPYTVCRLIRAARGPRLKATRNGRSWWVQGRDWLEYQQTASSPAPPVAAPPSPPGRLRMTPEREEARAWLRAQGIRI